MSKWTLGIGVYDTFDMEWALCRDYSQKPYNPYVGTEEELIEICIDKNKESGFKSDSTFNDHYGVIKYQLGEYGTISKCFEIWCPLHHRDKFQSSTSTVRNDK